MSSADKFMELLGAHPAMCQRYLNDALFHAQIEYTRQILAIVDEDADGVTATRITVHLFAVFAGDFDDRVHSPARQALLRGVQFRFFPPIPPS